MVNAKLKQKAIEEDKEMERTAWFTALLMSSSGNYGKKGIDSKKLYTKQFDELGNPIVNRTDKDGVFTPIDKEEKDSKMNELIAKFNKE